MADDKRQRNSLRSFDAYADRNGQDFGQDAPTDIGNPADLQRHLASDPGGEAETARLASGRPDQNATDATEAETPAENLKRISDPTLPPAGAASRSTKE